MDFGLVLSRNPEATEAEIASLSNALTRDAIDTGKLRFWLGTTHGLIVRNVRTNKFSGTLIELMLACEGQATLSPERQAVVDSLTTEQKSAIVAGLDKLIDHVFDDKSVKLATNENGWAIEAEEILSMLETIGELSHDLHVEFHELGGGLLVPGGNAQAADVAVFKVEVQRIADLGNFGTVIANLVAAAQRPLPDGTSLDALKTAIGALLA